MSEINDKVYESIAEASNAVIGLGIKSPEEYICNRDRDPRLATDPKQKYSTEWRGYGEWDGFLGLNQYEFRRIGVLLGPTEKVIPPLGVAYKFGQKNLILAREEVTKLIDDATFEQLERMMYLAVNGMQVGQLQNLILCEKSERGSVQREREKQLNLEICQ